MTVPARLGIVTLGVADLARSITFHDGYPWEIAHNPFFPIEEDGRLRIP